MILILISTVAFVVESLPELRSAPNTCGKGTDISCQPQMITEIKSLLYMTEVVCVVGFTIDYVTRLSAVAWTRPFITALGVLVAAPGR